MNDKFPEIILYTPQELIQSSYLRTGLYELERKGKLKCRFTFDLRERRGRVNTGTGTAVYSKGRNTQTAYFRLLDMNRQKQIDFAVDLNDNAAVFSRYALQYCQYVFKRNYQTRFIEPLEEDYKKKIRPLGLTFMVSNPWEKDEKLLPLATMFHEGIAVLRNSTFSGIGQLPKTLAKAREHWGWAKNAASMDDYRENTESPGLTILFQTRCFDPVMAPDIQELLDERAALIRVLRENFPTHFTGGFVPDGVSRNLFPHALTTLPTSQKDYLRLVREAGIVIYSRGKSNSPAWKMAEYLALGKCIVAESFPTELPVPLVDGKHLHFFRTIDEYLEMCRDLLNDEEARRRLGRNARRYYMEHVYPPVRMQQLIELMLKDE